jgi:hypothetical protein
MGCAKWKQSNRVSLSKEEKNKKGKQKDKKEQEAKLARY